VVAAARAGKVGYDLLTMPAEPETSLRGDLGATKRAAWTDTVDLAVIKAIGEAHDATVNDVLLAATAGALRRHLDGRGEQTEGLVLRCTVPVNLAPMADRAGSLGNHFGLAFVELPVGTRDLDDRIAFVRERTDRRRLGVEAFLVYQVLRAAGRTPEAAQRWAMGLFEDTATGIVTNVPGPLDSVEILGSEVSDITFWVPQANDQGLGVSIFSYDGGVRVGVAGDANLLADPGSLTDAFEAEVEALLADLPDAAVADRDVSGD
jgi:WS/DGAT/MGAT family acyltransferase